MSQDTRRASDLARIPEGPLTRRTLLKGAGSAGALLLGGSVLAACGSDSGGAATTAAGKTQDVTVKFWTHDPLLSVPFVKQEAKRLSAAANAPYRYKIVPTIIPADQIPPKARAAFLAKTNAPDLPAFEIGAFCQMMGIADQTLVDLTDAVGAVRGENIDKLWQPYAVGDRVYGVETSTSWFAGYFRPDEFKKLGLPAPDTFGTWDELLAAAERAAVPKGKVLGLIGTNSILATRIFMGFLQQAGGQIFNPDGSVALKSQAAVDALTMVSKAIQSGVFQAVEDSFAGPGAAALKSGNVIANPAADWYLQYVLQPSVPDQRNQWQLGLLPGFTADGPRGGYFGGLCFSVAKDSPVADATVELVKASILTKQGQLDNFKLNNLNPTWKSLYQEPDYLAKTAPFLGGQRVGEVYAKLIENVPSAPIQSADFGAAITVVGDELVAAYKGRKSPQAAISAASSALEAKVKEAQ
ncbi:MAG TPA: ABC transporter substrate-binding protein [Conexibacter sp.]|nr:ABC transporter substrate-binding protein [Conexibacter sp.]